MVIKSFLILSIYFIIIVNSPNFSFLTPSILYMYFFFPPVFSVPNLVAHLKAFPDSNWPDFGGIGKIWKSIFQIILSFEKQMVISKVMASGSELMCPAQFSRYLNYFNSNFDQWAIIWKAIRYSSQWYWFHLVLMVRSKLGYRLPLGVNFRSNFVKVDKKLQWSWIWCKNMETLGWLEIFWSFWPEMALWVLRYPKGLNHDDLNVPTVP